MNKKFRCEYSGLMGDKRFYIPHAKDPSTGTHTFYNLNCAISWLNENRQKYDTKLVDRYRRQILNACKKYGFEDVPPAPPLPLLKDEGKEAWLAAHSLVVAPDELSTTEPKGKKKRKIALLSDEKVNELDSNPIVPRRMERGNYTVQVVDQQGKKTLPVTVNNLDAFLNTLGIDYRPPVCAQILSNGDMEIYPLLTFDPRYMANTQLKVIVTNYKI